MKKSLASFHRYVILLMIGFRGVFMLSANEKADSLNLWQTVRSWCVSNNVADHLSAGISLGTMGLGVEIMTPLTGWVDLRAGVDWLPSVKVPMYFSLSTYSDGMPTGNFNKVADLLNEMTGIRIDDRVKMNGKAAMINFKLLFDVYPFRQNRHWKITAGFFAGTSKLATAINDTGEKPTLVGINIYNRGYEYFTGSDGIIDVPLGGGVYLNPDIVDRIQEKFQKYGRMGIRIGDFKDGTPYFMEPAPDGTVSAKAFVNHVKPYLGLGYATSFDKEGKWNFGFDIGALFWGGAPRVINHDYYSDSNIDFTRDLVNIRGKVGSYMKIVHALPVYPVISLRFSYNIL